MTTSEAYPNCRECFTYASPPRRSASLLVKRLQSDEQQMDGWHGLVRSSDDSRVRRSHSVLTQRTDHSGDIDDK